MLSRVVQTQELMTLVCVIFGLLSDSLIGRLEGNLLGRFQRFATPPSATTLSRVLRGFTPVISTFSKEELTGYFMYQTELLDCRSSDN